MFWLGYGKSDILCRVERAVKEYVNFHTERFMTATSPRAFKSSDECEETPKKGNRSDQGFWVDEKKQQTDVSSVPTVIVNDGTGAGILSQLESCPLSLCKHKADKTMSNWNVMQNGPWDRTMTRIDAFRSTLMTLYDDSSSFTCLWKMSWSILKARN